MPPSKIVDPFDNGQPQAAPQEQAGGVLDPFDDRQLGMTIFQSGRDVQTGTDKAAPFGTAALSSIMQDPKAKIRYFSKQMGIPEDKFGVIDFGSNKGQIAYETDGGQLQLANPPTVMRQIGQGVGPSFPAVGGAVGGVLGLGSGPVGAVIGGGAGATAGQGVREVIANKMGGQKISPKRMATEGMIDVGASVVGLLVGKGLERAAATRAAEVFDDFMKKGGQSAADALDNTVQWVNRKYGSNIKLTPAELTNSAELRGMQMALESRPATAPIIEDFASSRAKEAEKAFGGFRFKLAPNAMGPDEAGEALAQKSGKAIKAVKGQRVALGSPAYKTAFEASPIGVDTRGALNELKQQEAAFPAGAKTFKKVRSFFFEPDGKTPITDLKFIQDGTKESLDDAIDAATRAGKNKLAGRLRDVQKSLLSTLDQQVPEYKAARSLWGDLSKPVDIAEGGILVKLSAATPKDFEYIGKFLSTASPAEISRAKSRIFAVGGTDAWNSVLTNHLQHEWESAGKTLVSQIARPNTASAAQPARFWANLHGNTAQASRLKAAMTQDQWQAWGNLMDVFEATGRATNFNSITAQLQQGNRLLDQTNTAGRLFSIILDPVGTRLGMKPASEAVVEGMSERNLKDLTRVLTNDGSVQELLKINSRNTPRDKAIQVAVRAFEIATRTPMQSDRPSAGTPVFDERGGRTYYDAQNQGQKSRPAIAK